MKWKINITREIMIREMINTRRTIRMMMSNRRKEKRNMLFSFLEDQEVARELNVPRLLRNTLNSNICRLEIC